MPARRFLRPVLGAGLVLLAASCRDASTPAGPDDGPAAARVQPGQSAELPSAEQFDRQVPGFGGFFLDAQGNPTVYLARGSDRAPAERALAGYLSARGLGVAALRILEAQYRWQELQRWQAVATQGAFQSPGAVFVDNDETSNRVLIGVEDLASMGEVRSAVARLGVPDDAVIIQRAAPIVQVATLQNVIDRPVRAGVQIHFGQYLCSVGFNATSSSGQKSFVTASHCTNTQGGVEGTKYYQPLQSADGTVIATEVADPVYVKGGAGCPRGRRCRYSDASRAAYANGANQGLGLIAKTDAANSGSLTITGSFTIGSDDCTSTLGGCLATGTTVNKVGRTTGWTAGSITNTCVNTGVSGSNIVQLCQSFVSARVGGGDSGSDVFQNGGTTVKLAGTLWGGDSAGTMFVFSPFANITRELGTLITH